MAPPPFGRRWRDLSLLVLLAMHFIACARATDTYIYTVNGVGYELFLTTADVLATFLTPLKGTPWFNDIPLAKALAGLMKDSLGLPNVGGVLGPVFYVNQLPNDAVYWLQPGSTGSVANTYTVPTLNLVFVLGREIVLDKWRAFDPVTNSVLWVPQGALPSMYAGLDCRTTCANTFMLAVSAFKPTEATPNPPLLCAHIGALLNDPTLTVPGSLADEAHRFFLSEGYTQPIAANGTTGRPAEYDPRGCSSYLEGTTPNAQNYLCGCAPPRKSANGTPQKPWRWVPASTDSCNSEDVPFDGYFVPFVCRVRATGLIGHLNTQNCGFPSAEDIPDCPFGQNAIVQPASKFPAALNMPTADPDFPACVYITRSGVSGSNQEIARWNSIDKLCIASSFKYFVYRWAKQGVRPGPTP